MKNDIKKKKVLHVIHIVYDILSALFILFTSTVLIIYGATRSDEKTQDVLTPNIQEVKQRRNYGYVDEQGIIITLYNADFLSNSFFKTFLSSLVNGLYTNLAITNENAYSVDFNISSALYNVEGGAITSVITNLQKLTFSKNATTINELSGGTEVYDCWYQLKLINNNTTIIQYNYLFISPVTDSWEHDMGSSVIRSYVNNKLFNSDYYAYYENNNNMSICPFIEYYVKPDRDNTGNFYSQGYLDGYNLGYSLGDIAGYNRGYNTGKADGQQIGEDIGYGTGYNDGLVAGAQGIESNAFTVIGQAFDAVGNIFSIEILPGLPMWILAFAPLIIAVIIVVIKMIKG